MKIAIVGAGWYGCHLALSLIQDGQDVILFEQGDAPISGASRKNQNRLHQGFHYPRDYETRAQSSKGYKWFKDHYGHLSEEVPNNIYAVPYEGSNLDFETYRQIMTASGLDYTTCTDLAVLDKLVGIQGAVSTSEELIRNNKASNYFKEVLSDRLVLNTTIALDDDVILSKMKGEFDWVVDCTWGTARKIEGLDYFYEPCIYFYYRKKINEHFSFTLMDGCFFSLYPYMDDLYTLTSVKNTPISKTDNINIALAKLRSSSIDLGFIGEKKKYFEEEVLRYYPEFLQEFEYHAPEFSLKSKINSASDFRGCVVKKEGNIINVFSGKIDTLHIAEKEVFEIIGVL